MLGLLHNDLNFLTGINNISYCCVLFLIYCVKLVMQSSFYTTVCFNFYFEHFILLVENQSMGFLVFKANQSKRWASGKSVRLWSCTIGWSEKTKFFSINNETPPNTCHWYQKHLPKWFWGDYLKIGGYITP